MKTKLLVKALAGGVFAGLCSWGLHALLVRTRASWLTTYGCEALIAILGGLVVYQIVLQDLIFDQANHHIRNALTAVINAESFDDMREALERVDWTLTDVLRGRFKKE
jgi:hypothetical protein